MFTLDHESDVGRTIEQVAQYQVDGVLAAAHLTAEQIARFEQRNVPLVFYNRAYQDVAVSSVCCDQVEGERFLVNMLVETNTHSSYAIVSGPADSVVSMQRTQGAIDGLMARGVQDIVEINVDYCY